MKKLYCTKLDRPHEETEHCADGCVAVYLASEVDARIAELEGLLREAHKPRTVTHIPDSSGLTLPQLEAGKQALYACSEDPSFDDVRRVIAAVAQSNPAVPSGDGFESALITIWENLSTIRPDDFKQPDGEAETQVNRAYCAAENALLEVGRLRREGHSVELVPMTRHMRRMVRMGM